MVAGRAGWSRRVACDRLRELSCAGASTLWTAAPPATPHGAVREQPLFRDAAFCAPCHQFGPDGLSVNGKPLQNTYREWQASRYADEGVACQDCHMPDGRHGFKGVHDPEMVEQGLGVDVWRTRDGLLVHARNKGAGHALPTYVTPQIEVELSSAGGARRSHLIARRMRWSEHDGWTEIADDRLLPGQWIALSLALEPGERGWVRVRVDPGHDYHERIYPHLLDRWEDLSADARGALRRAQQEAARSAYLLIEYACSARPEAAPQPCAARRPTTQGSTAALAGMSRSRNRRAARCKDLTQSILTESASVQ